MNWKKMLWLAAPIGVVVGFLFAGDFLALNQAPVASDVIVVLGGGPPARVAKAVQLYRAGYAPRLLMSGGAVYNPWQDQAQHMRQQALERGVPASRILLDNRSLTTFQNALYTLQVMKAHHLTSAIVVSSTFHMRRAWADFSYVFFRPGHSSGVLLVAIRWVSSRHMVDDGHRARYHTVGICEDCIHGHCRHDPASATCAGHLTGERCSSVGGERVPFFVWP